MSLLVVDLECKRRVIRALEVARFLSGEVSRETMIEDLVKDIGRLARRQRTYFRGIRKRGMETHEVPHADLALAREILECGGTQSHE